MNKTYMTRIVVKSNGKVIQSRETTRASANKIARDMIKEFGDAVEVRVHQVGIMTKALFGV